MRTARTTVAFRIEGAFITSRARELFYQSNDLPGAIKLLTSCLKTDQLSQPELLSLALDILDGKKAIAGTYPDDDYGPVETPDDTSCEGVTKHLNNMAQRLVDIEKEARDNQEKLAFIAQHIGEDVCEDIDVSWSQQGEEGTIFNTDMMDVAMEMTRQRLFSHMVFGGEERFDENDDEEYSDSGVVVHDEDDRPSHFKSVRGGVLDRWLKDQKDKKGDDYGWLEPNGSFHAVEWGLHTEYARDVVEKYGWADDSDDIMTYEQARDILQSHGWVLIHSPGNGIPVFQNTKNLTKAQRDFLYGYYMDRNRPREAQAVMDDADSITMTPDQAANANQLLKDDTLREGDGKGEGYGWRDPNGAFHAVDWEQRTEYARDIAAKNGWADDTDNMTYERARDILQRHGWVLVQFYKNYDKGDGKCGWLDPNGTFYPVDFAAHNAFAFDMLIRLNYKGEMTSDRILSQYTDTLSSLGWALIHDPMRTGSPIVTKMKPLTKAQREFLFGFYTDRNRPEEARKYMDDSTTDF